MVHFLQARFLVILVGRLSSGAGGGGTTAQLVDTADLISARDCCHWALLTRDDALVQLSGFGWGQSVLGRGVLVEAPHLPSSVTGGETRSDPCQSSLSELLVESMYPLSP